MRQDACNATTARKLHSMSRHIGLSTTLLESFYSTKSKKPDISSVRKNVGKRSANAALIERTQSQELSPNDILLEDSSDIEYVRPTYPKQPKKTADTFTLHRDSAVRNKERNESGVSPSDKITLPVEKFNTLKQRLEATEHKNSFRTSSGDL